MLERVVAWPNLCAAWENVAGSKGCPGVDGVSIARFSRRWEENLRRLRQQVLGGAYRPARLRRVPIPKRRGGFRVLSIPTVADRVLQRAALDALSPLFEQLFLPCSFGYRPGRGLRDAVGAVLACRDRGQTWVLDADIDECFDSLDHALLGSLLAGHVDDGSVVRLLQRWAVAGQRHPEPARGIAQGMAISPLLCNVYLHELDSHLAGFSWGYVRYADDFVICCSSHDEASEARAATETFLERLCLVLEPGKTRITTFEEGFGFLGVHFQGDEYSFTWKDKQVSVRDRAPYWLWRYLSEGYSED